ncbi:hypothetical protein [Flavobacterium sp. CFS9]
MRSLFFESSIHWPYFAPLGLLPNDRIVFYYKYVAFSGLRITPLGMYYL